MAVRFTDILNQEKVVDLVPFLRIMEDGSGVDLMVKTDDNETWCVCRLDEEGLALYSGFEDIHIGIKTSGDHVKVHKE